MAESKDSTEDYTVIDQYFTEQINQLRQKTQEWNTKPKDTLTAYFDELNKSSIALRDHIATYHHCVPAMLYAKY